MNKPMVRIVELDGTIIDREMTNDEFNQWQEDKIKGEAAMEASEKAAAKRIAALSKLAALGLDEDDLKALGL